MSQLAHVVFPSESKKRRAFDAPSSRCAFVPREPPREIAAESTAFVAWVLARFEMDASLYRPETLARRLPACLRAVGATTPDEARHRIERSPTLASVAQSALLVGVSSFFRDAAPFDVLKRELASRPLGRSGHFVWSAGCSDGSELYSLALLLAEATALAGGLLLGTDCRADAIEQARRGEFDAGALEHVSAPLLARGFDEVAPGERWQIRPEIRRHTFWRVADVTRTPEPGLWDVILFRNVAMYLEPRAAEAVWATLERSLRIGGLLVVGKAERPTGARKLSAIGPGVHRRVHA